MSTTLRWGILGTGAIAKKFAAGLQSLPDAALAAIGSRSQAGADEFAAQFDVPRRHPSYDRLVNDSEVDAVYVATPHSCHKANALAATQAAIGLFETKGNVVSAEDARMLLPDAVLTE